MRVENARRLTGRGFFLSRAGAAVELWSEPGEDASGWREAFEREVIDPLLGRIGLGAAERSWHPRASGLTLAVAAPIDRLLAVADALEWAGLSFAGRTEVSLAEAVAAFERDLAEQEDPALLALQAAAAARGVPFLWDDDAVSLGLGRYAETFTPRALPAPEAVDEVRPWSIPVGLVTGTNGKTTTTRMVSRILSEAGRVVGMSSTDAIAIGDQVIEEGDWTGPGAARKVLRHRAVEVAVLETARGGILRRGLAYEQADAALVTNIGEDHFGDFGITAIDDMARIKAVVWSGVRDGGKRIANAGCAISRAYLLRERADAIGGADWVLIGRDEAELARHIEGGGEAWRVRDGRLVHHWAGRADAVLAVDEIPATFGGAAAHNVDNAMAAAALASALGASDAEIARGLGAFGARPEDNPGRLELHRVAGRLVLLDFGHNPHGVSSLAPVVASLRARTPGGARLLVVSGQAGDRSDHDIRELARAIMKLAPDRVALRPMRGYERGRESGEVERVFHAALAELGLGDADNVAVSDEVAALQHGMAWSRPGDVLLVLVHVQRAEVKAWLRAVARERREVT